MRGSWKWWLISLIGVVPPTLAATNNSSTPLPSPKTAAQRRTFDRRHLTERFSSLRWQEDKRCGVCGGRFIYPAITWPSKAALDTSKYDYNTIIEAERQAYFHQNGNAFLSGNVEIKQRDKQLKAQEVNFTLNAKRDKIVHLALNQGVSYFDANGTLVTARSGSFNFLTHEFTLFDGFYRLPLHTFSGASEMWGYAQAAHSEQPNVFVFNSASYTTCAPKRSSWYLYGEQIILNQDEGVGEAKHARLYIQNVPVLYLPKFSFLLDNRRRTGWLTPVPRITGASGVGIDLPFYLNLAPNYDLTLTPKIYSKRGVLLNGDFRFLTATSHGSVWGSWIPHDRNYHDFVKNMPQVTAVDDEGLGNNRSWWRAAVSVNSVTTMNKNWHGDVRLNYVTDHYFVRDFGVLPSNFGNRDQLLNQVLVQHRSLHTEFSVKAEAFQTLGSIYNTTLRKQYYRVPEVSFETSTPSNFRWQASLEGGAVHFEHDHHDQNVVGVRFALTPTLQREWSVLNATVATQAKWFNSFYFLKNPISFDDTNTRRVIRSVPIFSVDTKWRLYRDTNAYQQVLEPRVFYLYVPNVQQNQVPNFDTYLPSFSYHQMFRSNRFAGVDRVGDAHQATLGFKSTILSHEGGELFNFALGQTVAFHRHQQWIDGSSVDPLVYKHLSPLVGTLSARLNERWSINLDGAWDFSHHQRFNNVNAALSFQLDDYRVMNFWYNYALLSDQRQRREWVDFNRIGGSLGWRLHGGWRALATLNYNISYRRIDNFTVGLEYDSCCWAFRVAYNSELDGFDIERQGRYTRGVFLQVMLKGLSSVSMGSLNRSDSWNINGYRDIFKYGR